MTTYSQARTGYSCDACGQGMAFPLFCDQCGADYPERRGMSPFGLVGLEASFDVDDSALEAAELSLARRLHPDRWTAGDPSTYRKALLAQTLVNGAIQAVRAPFDRGETLLAMQPEAQEGALGDGKDLPQEFLIEQLELQEEMENGLDASRKRDLKKQVGSTLNGLREEVARGFSTAQEAEPGTTERLSGLRQVRRALDTARYWRNIQLALRGDAPS